ADRLELARPLDDLDAAAHAESGGGAVDDCAHELSRVAFRVHDRLGLARLADREDAGGLEADTENAALALLDDLELQCRLVEPRMQAGKLLLGVPLRLADGVALRFDLHLLAHRPPFFLRLTRRTWGFGGSAPFVEAAFTGSGLRSTAPAR